MEAHVYASTEYCKAKLMSHESKLLPFNLLQPGKSFFIPFGVLAEGSVRSIISAESAKLGRNFKCIKNKEEGYYEVTEVVDSQVLTFQIVDSSPEAKEMTDNGLGGKRAYPFFELPEGMSFIIPIGANADKIEKSLRVGCCVQSKKLGKRFILFKHEKYGMFEIYHCPKKKLEFFQPSVEMQEKVSSCNVE